MPRFDRLTDIIDLSSANLPSKYKLTIVNARSDILYEFVSFHKLVLIQSFAPLFDKLEKSNKVYPFMTEKTDICVVQIPKSKIEGFGNIADAVKMTNSLVIIDGNKIEGIDSYLKKIGSLTEILFQTSKDHGKAFCFDPKKINTTTVKQWEKKARIQKNKDGFFSVEGAFSSKRVDIGSRELANYFSDKVRGHVADLGAGWGWLSFEALKQNIKKVDLYEAYHLSIQCAKLNIIDSRANFFWMDVMKINLTDSYDTVIMNPPFHIGQNADPNLGINFIKKASEILNKNGHLLMVANRKLPYEKKLNELFKDIVVHQGFSGFKIIRAKKPR